jgi:hypothetical protein
MERRKPTAEELAQYLVLMLEEGCRRFTLAREKEGLTVPDSSELSNVEPQILKDQEDLTGYEAEMLEGVDAERFAFEMKIFLIFAAMKALVGKGEKLFWAFHREAARLLFDDESKVHIAFMILGERYSEYWDALCAGPQTMGLTKAFLKNVEAREAHPGTLFLYTTDIFGKLKMIQEMVVKAI